MKTDDYTRFSPTGSRPPYKRIQTGHSQFYFDLIAF